MRVWHKLVLFLLLFLAVYLAWALWLRQVWGQ
jgi:hypothetical protein